jgi:hypothetical protein
MMQRGLQESRRGAIQKYETKETIGITKQTIKVGSWHRGKQKELERKRMQKRHLSSDFAGV